MKFRILLLSLAAVMLVCGCAKTEDLDALQNQIDEIKDKADGLQGQVDNLPDPSDRIDAVEAITSIQSIAIIPTYSDGTVCVSNRGTEMDVEIRPLAAAEKLASLGTEIFDVKAVYAEAKASSMFIDLPVKDVVFEDEAVKLTLDASGLGNDFFFGMKGASARVCVSEGKLERASKYVPLSITEFDLSAPGTANCYIVNSPGRYCFKGTVMGNSDESVGEPVSAEVLWESFGTDVAPKVGDIITEVKYDEGYVCFKTPEKLADGNALIAVKGADGTILWSWHIWVCEGFDPDATAHVYFENAGTVMDRNLGATSATPGDVKAHGLMYQWGRKDPFMGGNGTRSSTPAAVTHAFPNIVETSATVGQVSYAVQHPTTFIGGTASSNYAWFDNSIESWDKLWVPKSATKYDPCPSGWGLINYSCFIKASNFTDGWKTASNYDTNNRGINFGATDKRLGDYPVIWYPDCGVMIGSTGGLREVGERLNYWLNTTPSFSMNTFQARPDGEIMIMGSRLGYGLPVRCQKVE